MTNEEIKKQTLEAVSAMIDARGIIQANSRANNPDKEAGWADLKDLLYCEHPNFEFFNYRIKPQPKLRLMRVDDLPPVFWVREIGFQAWHLVSEIRGNGIIFGNGGSFTLEPSSTWAARCEWSPDRKQINSFFKPEDGV